MSERTQSTFGLTFLFGWFALLCAPTGDALTAARNAPSPSTPDPARNSQAQHRHPGAGIHPADEHPEAGRGGGKKGPLRPLRRLLGGEERGAPPRLGRGGAGREDRDHRDVA